MEDAAIKAFNDRGLNPGALRGPQPRAARAPPHNNFAPHRHASSPTGPLGEGGITRRGITDPPPKGASQIVVRTSAAPRVPTPPTSFRYPQLSPSHLSFSLGRPGWPASSGMRGCFQRPSQMLGGANPKHLFRYRVIRPGPAPGMKGGTGEGVGGGSRPRRITRKDSAAIHF